MEQKSATASSKFCKQEVLERKIFLIRNKKIMIDKDLAALYVVSVKYLKRQVRRNKDRFPMDFMFQLTREELKNWILNRRLAFSFISFIRESLKAKS